MNCCSGTRREENCSCSALHKAAKTRTIELTSSSLDFSELKTTARRWVKRKDVVHLKIGDYIAFYKKNIPLTRSKTPKSLRLWARP
jgi:hypothetical protein